MRGRDRSFSGICCNDTATTEIYCLSLHDALPISSAPRTATTAGRRSRTGGRGRSTSPRRASASRAPCRDRGGGRRRSEEHTSELQSRQYLVCRLLLEKNTSPALVTVPA